MQDSSGPEQATTMTTGMIEATVLAQKTKHSSHSHHSNHNHNHKPLQLVYNPTDGSVLRDHHNVPVTVDRLLATKPLRHELSTRPGPSGKKLTYISGDGVSRTLNDIFGYDGWNLDISSTNQVDCTKDTKHGKYQVVYTAQVRLTHLASGAYKEDCGAGDAVDKVLGTAIGHALKSAITDAMKRAARHFGDKLGNSLYNGNFGTNKAPTSLKDALDQLDIERANTKFGFPNKQNHKVSDAATVATTKAAGQQQASQQHKPQQKNSSSVSIIKKEPTTSTSTSTSYSSSTAAAVPSKPATTTTMNTTSSSSTYYQPPTQPPTNSSTASSQQPQQQKQAQSQQQPSHQSSTISNNTKSSTSSSSSTSTTAATTTATQYNPKLAAFANRPTPGGWMERNLEQSQSQSQQHQQSNPRRVSTDSVSQPKSWNNNHNNKENHHQSNPYSSSSATVTSTSQQQPSTTTTMMPPPPPPASQQQQQHKKPMTMLERPSTSSGRGTKRPVVPPVSTDTTVSKRMATTNPYHSNAQQPQQR